MEKQLRNSIGHERPQGSVEVTRLWRAIKRELPIQFGNEQLTSYGGLELLGRCFRLIGLKARIGRAFGGHDLGGDYGAAHLVSLVIGLLVVGTRPPTKDETPTYLDHHQRPLSMKPGLTGLWQVSGDGAVKNFEDVMKLDCQYIDNWSLWRDAKILAKTVAKVLRGDAW